jgi:anaerobic selenocysteine-containing dehydrogenase
MSRLTRYQHDPAFEIITGACPHDCPDTCSWQVAVEKASGRAIDIWGHAGQPVTQGKLCGKVDRYLERTYHATRLTTPLKRVGRKGEGSFVPISWHEAMAIAGAQLGAVIATHGPEAVLPYSYAGTMGLLQGEGMASRFFHKMGASRLERTICAEAGFFGYVYTIGATEGMETEAFAHARLILIWGSNTLTSNLHLWPFIADARSRGARVIVIDPAETRTARAADEWIAIRPGTDGALALALMHVIIAEGLHDAAYVAQQTLGFDALAARVTEWTPARAAEVTGIPAERIVALAREYATARPAAIRVNYGLQRHRGGGMAMRTITCLPALVGAWREEGGGIQLSTSGAYRHLDRSGLYRPDLLAGRDPRRINMNRLADALSLDAATRARALYHPRPIDPVPTAGDAGAPVHALIVYNCNPVAVAPDQGAVTQALQRDDLFTIVLEQFPTDTVDYADLVLPATTQLEHWELMKAYGHLYLALNRPAIAPVGEALPNSEIFRRLAAALGYDDPCFAESDEQILRDLVAAQRHPRFEGVTWDRLLREGFVRLNLPSPWLPFAEGNFPTPSGKCEFYSQRMEADGYDPVPTYTPPAWQDEQSHPAAEAASDERLVVISPPAHSFLNSTFVNIERFRAREGEPVLQMHPADAAARGLVAGDTVRVANEYGAVTLPLRLTDGLAPGTVLAPGVWWAKFSGDGRTINQVVPQDEADMGAGAIFYDTLVRVERAEPAARTERPPTAAALIMA